MNIGTAASVVAASVFMSSAPPLPPSVAGSGAPSAPVATGSGAVVVNEFAAGAYVELRNNTGSIVDIGGFGLWLCDPGAVLTEVRVSQGQTLSPGGFYVVAASSFTGGQADQIVGDVLPGGGAMLLDADHDWVDGVAVTTERAACGEGAPASACGLGSTARDAAGTDTGRNAADFACRTRSPGEPNPAR